LFKATVRGLLLEAAMQGLYQPVWSYRILNELIEALVNRVPLDVDAAIRQVRLWVQPFPEAAVDVSSSLVRRMTNESGDRHVLAAAVAGKAPEIVTFNLKDFPDSALARYSIRGVSPDAFLESLLTTREQEMMAVVSEYVAMLQAHEPDATVWTLVRRLIRCGLPESAHRIKERASV
jgi:predicted nucleic acid-binding protein